MLPIEQDKWCLHEEGRRIDPFLKSEGRVGKGKATSKMVWKQPRLWNFREGKLDWGGGHLCITPSPPPASFDHLLVYMLLPGSKSQLKVDYKAMKQRYYEGRVTPIHFYLIWWLIQGFQWYWAREDGSCKPLLTSGVAAQSGLWGDSCAHQLLSSAKKGMSFVTYWKCPATQTSRTSLPWESLQWNETAQKRAEKMLSQRK